MEDKLNKLRDELKKKHDERWNEECTEKTKDEREKFDPAQNEDVMSLLAKNCGSYSDNTRRQDCQDKKAHFFKILKAYNQSLKDLCSRDDMVYNGNKLSTESNQKASQLMLKIQNEMATVHRTLGLFLYDLGNMDHEEQNQSSSSSFFSAAGCASVQMFRSCIGWHRASLGHRHVP